MLQQERLVVEVLTVQGWYRGKITLPAGGRILDYLNTKPEMIVRRLVHGMGYRYRLHARDLPGNPDLAFRHRKKVIFVHGCFWHQHGCRQYRQPRTKREFWEPKLAKNKERDAEVRRQFRKLGWRVMVVWECQVKKETVVRNRVKRFLDEK